MVLAHINGPPLLDGIDVAAKQTAEMLKENTCRGFCAALKRTDLSSDLKGGGGLGVRRCQTRGINIALGKGAEDFGPKPIAWLPLVSLLIFFFPFLPFLTPKGSAEMQTQPFR